MVWYIFVKIFKSFPVQICSSSTRRKGQGKGGGGFLPITAKRRKRLNGPFGFPFSVLSLKLKDHNESRREWNAVSWCSSYILCPRLIVWRGGLIGSLITRKTRALSLRNLVFGYGLEVSGRFHQVGLSRTPIWCPSGACGTLEGGMSQKS